MALCCQDPHPENLRRAGRSEIDLPLNFHPATIRPYVRGMKVARPRGKLNRGVALDRPEPCPMFSEGEP